MRKTVKQIMDNQKHFPQTWVCPKDDGVEGEKSMTNINKSVDDIMDNILDVLDLAKNEATRSRIRPFIKILTTHNQTTHDRLKAGIEGMRNLDYPAMADEIDAHNQALTDVLALVDEVYKDKN